MSAYWPWRLIRLLSCFCLVAWRSWSRSWDPVSWSWSLPSWSWDLVSWSCHYCLGPITPHVPVSNILLKQGSQTRGPHAALKAILCGPQQLTQSANICSVTPFLSRSTRRLAFLISTSFYQSTFCQTRGCSCKNHVHVWQYIRLWAVLLVNEAEQISFTFKTYRWTSSCNTAFSYRTRYQAKPRRICFRQTLPA